MENELIVVITGAAGGIGKAVGDIFSETRNEKFKRIVMVDHPLATGRLTTLATPLNTKCATTRSSFYTHDIEKHPAETPVLINEILSSYGKIDVLVNVAGISPQKFLPLVKANLEEAHSIMNVNFWGALYMCRAVLPHMRAQGYGRIINISSIAAQRGDPGNAVYAASKAAIESLTKTLAKEAQFNKGGPLHDITVNAVAPGIIDTPMKNLLSKETVEGYCHANPTGRIGQPEEVAKAIHWLATEAQYVNGQVINVDGGFMS